MADRDPRGEFARLRYDPNGDTPWTTKCDACPPNHVPIQGGALGMAQHRWAIHGEGERPDGI